MIMHSLFFSLLFISCRAQEKPISVNVDTFEKDIFSGSPVQLLDVRTPAEFQSGYIKGAMLANWNEQDEFKRRTDALDKEKPVYIYCLSGGRSAAAAKSLRSAGFKSVVEMEGGINAWKQADKPLIGQEKLPQISEETFQDMLQSSKVVLVDFGAEWCPPCRKMEPIIQDIEKEQGSSMALIKIDGGSQEDLMKSKNIQIMPTFIIYKDGVEVWRKAGLLDKPEIEEALKAAY